MIDRIRSAEQQLQRRFVLILGLQLLLITLLPAAQTQAQVAPDNRLEVALRSTDGQGITGITVTLAPRPAELGGPVEQQQERVAVTDAGGWVAFDHLPGGIWLLSFSGSVAGLPLQAPADQGRPPYGTSPDGRGFVLAVGSSGDDIGVEDSGLGGDQSRVTQALFVGRAQSGVWTPEYDLSDPSRTPQPLSLGSTPLIVPTLDVRGATATATGESHAPALDATAEQAATATGAPVSAGAATTGISEPVEISPLLLCYAPGLLLGLGLLGWAWLARRHLQEERG